MNEIRNHNSGPIMNRQPQESVTRILTSETAASVGTVRVVWDPWIFNDEAFANTPENRMPRSLTSVAKPRRSRRNAVAVYH